MKVTQGLIVTLLTGTMMTSSAQASITTLVISNGQPAGVMQKWVDEAFVPVVPGRVLIHPSYCPNLPVYPYPIGGYSCINSPGYEMWLKVPRPEKLRRTLAHELGHRFDWQRSTYTSQKLFMKIMGYRGTWGRNKQKGLAPPFELFADAYSACFRLKVLRTWLDATYNYNPSPRQHAQVCKLVRAMGRPGDFR